MRTPHRGVFFLVIFLLLFSVNGSAASVQELFLQGEDARMLGRYYQAVEYYKTALQINPAYLEPLIGLAEAYFALGEYQEALRYAEAAHRYDRQNGDLMNLQGRILLGLARFDEAGKLFGQVLKSQPNNINAQFGMAELEIAQGKIQNAANRFRSALRISPENRRALLSLVLLYDDQGNPGAAENYIEQALHFYADNAQVRYIAGNHYYHQGSYTEALNHVKAALRINPDYLDAGLLSAQLSMKTGDFSRAAEILRPFLSQNRDNPLLWYALGTAYRGSEKHEEAIHAFDTASVLRTGDDMARIALENILIEHLPLDDPRRERYAAYHFVLGKEYDQRNLLQRSLQEFRRGLQIAPYSREGRLLLADIYRRNGTWGRYGEELNLLVKEGLSNVDVQDELEFLINRLEDSVASSWKVDQFSMERQTVTLGLFYIKSLMYHPGGEQDLITYIQSLLSGYHNLQLLDTPAPVSSFAEAYRSAREGGSDYFILLEIEESERVISFKSRIFLSETGGELKNWAVFRTGNQRIPDAAMKLARDIHSLIPVFGRIRDRRFDTGLADLGLVDNIVKDQKLLIIRNGDLMISKTDFGFEYPESAILGEFTVTALDDLICEGTIKNRSFFDMINQGDYLIPMEEPTEETESTSAVLPPEIYRSLLRIQ